MDYETALKSIKKKVKTVVEKDILEPGGLFEDDIIIIAEVMEQLFEAVHKKHER